MSQVSLKLKLKHIFIIVFLIIKYIENLRSKPLLLLEKKKRRTVKKNILNEVIGLIFSTRPVGYFL